ncbi:DUF1707 domain-containing protein [Micromonospora sp. CPCC 205371]|nr:DUF1707 domain-containing protein [Micromonospora sp. CPCC 205371]
MRALLAYAHAVGKLTDKEHRRRSRGLSDRFSSHEPQHYAQGLPEPGFLHGHADAPPTPADRLYVGTLVGAEDRGARDGGWWLNDVIANARTAGELRAVLAAFFDGATPDGYPELAAALARRGRWQRAWLDRSAGRLSKSEYRTICEQITHATDPSTLAALGTGSAAPSPPAPLHSAPLDVIEPPPAPLKALKAAASGPSPPRQPAPRAVPRAKAPESSPLAPAQPATPPRAPREAVEAAVPPPGLPVSPSSPLEALKAAVSRPAPPPPRALPPAPPRPALPLPAQPRWPTWAAPHPAQRAAQGAGPAPRDGSHLRISNADRQRAGEALAVALTDGRLSLAEYGERLEAVQAAKTYGDLLPQVRHLDALASDAEREPVIRAVEAAGRAGALDPAEKLDLLHAARTVATDAELSRLSAVLRSLLYGAEGLLANPRLARVADADRDRVVLRLQAAIAEGRLTLDEYDERVRQTYAARRFADFEAILGDLPELPAYPTSDAD